MPRKTANPVTSVARCHKTLEASAGSTPSRRKPIGNREPALAATSMLTSSAANDHQAQHQGFPAISRQ